MKPLTVLAMSVLLFGCASMEAQWKQNQAQQAKADAELEGNSGPLYRHYESCLNQSWTDALDSGNGAIVAYDIGVEDCGYELSLLCDYYAVDSCYLDAEASTRVLFLLLRQDYALSRL